MKPTFITLVQAADGRTLRINVAHIIAYAAVTDRPDLTAIDCLGGINYFVANRVDVVDQKIAEALR